MTEIKELPQIEQDKFVAAVQAAVRQLPFLMQHMETVAKLRRKAYLSYIEEGFTEQQALELCKNLFS